MKALTIPILFEDEFFMAVNKPPNIVVNRALSVKEKTIQDWIETTQTFFRKYSSTDSTSEFIERSGFVHRIDKETSGVLLIAKDPESFRILQEQFKDRTIHKTYRAIIHGILSPDNGEIRAPVGRLPWNKEQFGIVPGGKDSVTKYTVLQTFRNKQTNEDLSYVELYPETGRTHQIRVHLKYIFHPIIGDYLYAGRKVSKRDRTWAPRTMLHAYKIALHHPHTGTPLEIQAPVPDDMTAILS